jgi:hypothetical protein
MTGNLSAERVNEPLAAAAESGPPMNRDSLRWFIRRWVDVTDDEFGS